MTVDRAQAAQRAAETRKRRRALRVDLAAIRLLRDLQTKRPRTHCGVCGRTLKDEASRARGIGPECWNQVLRILEDER